MGLIAYQNASVPIPSLKPTVSSDVPVPSLKPSPAAQNVPVPSLKPQTPSLPAPDTAQDVIRSATYQSVGFDEFVAAQAVFDIARQQKAGVVAPTPSANDIYKDVLSQLTPVRAGRLRAAVAAGGTPPVPPSDAKRDAAADLAGDLVPNIVPGTSKVQGPPAPVGVEASVDLKGALTIPDAYDVSMSRNADGSYTATLKTQVQFNFRDTETAAWTKQSRADFVEAYERDVERVWDGAVIGKASDGNVIRLDVDIDSRMAGSGEKWNVDVAAAKPGFAQSWVVASQGTAKLDQNDTVPAIKASSGLPQTGAAHEFGHMIGLKDEYFASSPHFADADSVMHGGEVVEARHTSNIERVAQAILSR